MNIRKKQFIGFIFMLLAVICINIYAPHTKKCGQTSLFELGKIIHANAEQPIDTTVVDPLILCPKPYPIPDRDRRMGNYPR